MNLAEQALTSPVRDEIDNLIVNFTPMPLRIDRDQVLLGAINASDNEKGECSDVTKTFPPGWEGVAYTRHFIDAAPVFKADYRAENEITHIVALEHPTLNSLDGVPFKFGHDWISHDGIILLYSEGRRKFYHFHCRQCVLSAMVYIAEMQAQWAPFVQHGSSTMN